MYVDRESLETAAAQAFQEAGIPSGSVPASEIFKLGFYAGFRAAKVEEQELLLKTMDPNAR